jgi:hypothetical protein
VPTYQHTVKELLILIDRIISMLLIFMIYIVSASLYGLHHEASKEVHLMNRQDSFVCHIHVRSRPQSTEYP